MTTHFKKYSLAIKICVTLALLAILGLWAPFIAKELLEMPTDYSYSADIISYDNLYDAASQQYTGRTQSQTTFSYTTVRTEGTTNIINAVFDVHSQEGEPIFSVTREYAVNQESYQHVPGYGDENRTGYLFGPSGYNKDNFTYWHINYDKPLTMIFQNEENILGLNTYHYKANFTADQTANLTNLQDVGITKGINLDGTIDLWIEPYTGELVDYQDAATAYYYDLATGERLSPWNQFSNQFSFDSISSHAAQAEQRKTTAFITSEVVPAILMGAIAFFTAWAAISVKKIWRLRIKSRVIALNSALIMTCTVIISAWLINDSSDLLTLFGTTSEIHPITALFILLICLANVILALKKTLTHKQNVVLYTILGVIIFSSLVNIIRNILGISFVLIPGAALIPSAISLGVILSALLAITVNTADISYRRRIIYRILIILLFALGTISIIGNAYNFSYATSSGWYASTNVAAAIMFLMLAVSGWDTRFLPRKKPVSIENKTAKPLVMSLFIIFISICITGIAWGVSKDATNRNLNLRFESDTNKIEDLITQRLNSYINALQGADSLFSASENVTREEWSAYVDGLELAENYPGDQGIGYSLIVPSSQVQTIEQQVRDEGYPNFTIHPIDPSRDIYTTIIYIEPFDTRNQRSFGYDMFSKSTRQAAMETARDTGSLSMSGKVTLQQETSEDIQAGFLLYLPQYQKNSTNNTLQQRQNNIRGYIYSPIRVKNFMQAAVGNQSNGVGIAIYDTADITQTNSDNLLFNSDPGTDFASAELTKTTQLTTGGRTWTIQYANLSGYITSASKNTPLYALLGGLSISVLLGVAFFGLASSRQRALNLAQRITGYLKKEKDKAVHLQQKDEAILASIGEGLILYGVNEKIERINAAALKMLNYSESEVIGHNFTDVLKATYKKQVNIPHSRRPSIAAIQKNIAINTKLTYSRKDGSSFPVEITVAPIMAHGKAIGAIEVFRDITNEVALDQAKSNFISLASHQLRTPLTTNKWYVEMLLSGDAGKLLPKQSSLLRKVNVSNEHLIDLVVSLLNVTRIESGRLSINPQPTDLCKLIYSTIDIVQPKLNSKKQKISVDCPTLPKIPLDSNMVRQVVMNFLTNAIKYSPENTKINVKIERKGDFIQCGVKDEGYGIPEDQQKNVFGEYFRAKNIAQKEPEGNGLGLYLAKKIIETSGGKIGFTSVQNKGTTFYFTLPLTGMRAKKGEVTLENRYPSK